MECGVSGLIGVAPCGRRGDRERPRVNINSLDRLPKQFHGMSLSMTSEIPIRLVLVDAPAGVDFGIQHGRGTNYESLFVQQRKRRDVSFDFSLTVADNRKDGLPNFQGPFAQGPPARRFVYVDVGTYAGQKHTRWARRMIVPLQGVTWALIRKVLSRPGHRLSARVPGTGKDGGPNCATVQLLGDWEVIKDGHD